MPVTDIPTPEVPRREPVAAYKQLRKRAGADWDSDFPKPDPESLREDVGSLCASLAVNRTVYRALKDVISSVETRAVDEDAHSDAAE